jgi:CheY-like chemotaxis protein
MPVLDGIELAKRIRTFSLNARVPIVILTALNDAGTMREVFRVGVSSFLGKPFT